MVNQFFPVACTVASSPLLAEAVQIAKMDQRTGEDQRSSGEAISTGNDSKGLTDIFSIGSSDSAAPDHAISSSGTASEISSKPKTIRADIPSDSSWTMRIDSNGVIQVGPDVDDSDDDDSSDDNSSSETKAPPMNRLNELGKKIGKGGFGDVFEVVLNGDSEGRRYALKIMRRMEHKDVRLAQKEAQIHRKLKHENIIEHIECFIYEGKFCMLMELASYGDLNKLIFQQKKKGKPWPTAFILNAIKQIISGLGHAHEQNIMHRDLKPANVLVHALVDTAKDDWELSEGAFQLKLSDFGLAREMDTSKDYAITQCGTRVYMSAEAYDGRYSFTVDIWPVGCILYELCMLKPAISSTQIRLIFAGALPEISHQSGTDEDWAQISHLCTRMLNRNSSRRPLCKDILTHLDDIRRNRYIMKQTATEREIEKFTLAVDDGDVEELNELSEIDIDINVQSVIMDKEKKTNALHYAAERGNRSIVRALVQNFNCQLIATDSAYEIPLHKAVLSGKVRVVEMLLTGLKDESPSTDVVLQIVAQNDIGKTPEDIANDLGHTDIATLLQAEKGALSPQARGIITGAHNALERQKEELIRSWKRVKSYVEHGCRKIHFFPDGGRESFDAALSWLRNHEVEITDCIDKPIYQYYVDQLEMKIRPFHNKVEDIKRRQGIHEGHTQDTSGSNGSMGSMANSLAESAVSGISSYTRSF